MLPNQNFRVGSPHLQGFTQIARPSQRCGLPNRGRKQAVKVVRGVLRHLEHFQLRQIEMKFSGALLSGAIWNTNSRPSMMRVSPVAMTRGLGLRTSATSSCRHRFAEPAINLSARAAREERSELVLRPSQHRIARDHVLRDGEFHEQVRRDDRHAPATDIVVAETPRAPPQ